MSLIYPLLTAHALQIFSICSLLFGCSCAICRDTQFLNTLIDLMSCTGYWS